MWCSQKKKSATHDKSVQSSYPLGSLIATVVSLASFLAVKSLVGSSKAGCMWGRQARLLTAPAPQVSAVTVLKFVIIFEREVPQSHFPPTFQIKR